MNIFITNMNIYIDIVISIYKSEEIMKKFNSSAIFIFLVIILNCLTTACAYDEDNITIDNETDIITETSVLDIDNYDYVIGSFAKNDFAGYQFLILDRSAAYDSYWFTYDVFSAELNGDPINDAVYERNMKLEEMYNIKVKEKQDKSPYATAQKSILAGDDEYDVLTDGLYQLGILSSKVLLTDYNFVDGIDLTNQWWDQAMCLELSILNHIYYATGDISVMDNEGTWCVLFNKDLAKNYKVGDLYSMVDTGKWTIDFMYETTKSVSLDLNGDSKMTIDDRWGLLTESFNTYGFWIGGGDKIISKDENDIPFITIYNDHSVSMIDKVLTLQFDKGVTFSSSSAPDYTSFSNVFSNGNAMFLYCSMLMITNFRASDTYFGILPAAKFDESQDNYYNTYSNGNCTAYSIPVTSSDMSRTGIILETMAAISKYKLTPAYYDISLKGKFLRDTESEKMIDLILATRNYDLGSVLNLGGAINVIIGANASFDFASSYAKIEEKILNELESYIASIQNN